MEQLHNGDILDQIKEYLAREHAVTPDQCIVTGLLWAVHDTIKALRAEPEVRELTCKGCDYEQIMPSAAECHGCARMYGDHYTHKPKETP